MEMTHDMNIHPHFHFGMSGTIIGKKRPRAESNMTVVGERENEEKRALGDSQRSIDLPSSIHKMRLEAIFHPKFENENRTDMAVRREMMQRVSNQQGYLEVTLKHSGSLVLWSGHTRVYSKNSVDNQYTHSAEMLLRQHFERAWRGKSNCKYDECSIFVMENRLTLAFEVVTSVLGDHGDRPRKDFVILTAIADRSRERFYSTEEVIQLSQRFRLPHNDIWMVDTADSAKCLFDLYDTLRETGTARDTVEALNSAAEVSVPSMYPHEVFQGEILEGIIIRYVPYAKDEDIVLTRQLMERHSEEAKRILEDVPVELPFSFEHAFEDKAKESVLRSNLRDISRACDGFTTIENGENKFQDALHQILSDDSPRPTFQKYSDKSIDLPAMTKHLTDVTDDIETNRIACMLQIVASLNKPVSYIFVKEKSTEGRCRWLCIVHVRNDETFKQYHMKRSAHAMNLFRGFCIEINGTDMNEFGSAGSFHENEDCERVDDFLMLKMKFLPYMTRTFLCRNNLRVIEKEGPLKFYRLVESMLNKWVVSTPSKNKLIPFLESWAVYAHSALTTAPMNRKRLTQSNYLDYLEEFTRLYNEGKAPKPIKPNYKGTVIVVAPLQEDAEHTASVISKKLEAKVSPVSPDALVAGHVVYCSIFNAVSKVIKKRIGQISDTLSIILIGFGEVDLNAKIADEKHRVKALGFSKAWKKYDCAQQIDLSLKNIPPSTKNVEPSEVFFACIQQLKSVTERDTDPQSRGLLIFFPQIPGCGKSTIVKSRNGTSIFKDKGGTSRTVSVLEGDAVGKSFWSQLRKMRRVNSRCVMIADKNAPPNALKLIGLNCCDTNGVPVAVVPDDSALKTTHINGTTFPDGGFASDTVHFYPFSLSYLAVCMCRVLQRPPKSHSGKLDQSTPNACMILVLFFSLYRSISAESFRENINSRVVSGGALVPVKSIVLPFLRDAMERPLPDDLRAELVAALQLQRGYDVRKKKPKASDTAIRNMEKRLRESIEKYQDVLSKLTVDSADSGRAFIEQVAKIVSMLDVDAKEEQFLKLASIDLEKSRIHQILINRSSTCSCTRDFLDMAQKKSTKENEIQNGCYTCSRFVVSPHITLIHHNDFDQNEMKTKFAHLQGKDVNVLIVGFLWNEQIAAFAVEVEETTIDGQPMLLSQNKFVHTTVWFDQGEKAIMSNELPELVAQNKARHVQFSSPIKLRGKLTFWGMSNAPIIV